MSTSYNSALLNDIINIFQSGEKKRAYKKMEQYLKTFPKDLTAIYNFGYIANELNFIDIAIKNYQKVINSDKLSWRSRFNLYIIYIEQKKFELALDLINSVLEIKKDYQPALRDKALVLYYLNKQDKAFDYIQKSLNLKLFE